MVNTSTGNGSEPLVSEEGLATPLSSVVPLVGVLTPPSVNGTLPVVSSSLNDATNTTQKPVKITSAGGDPAFTAEVAHPTPGITVPPFPVECNTPSADQSTAFLSKAPGAPQKAGVGADTQLPSLAVDHGVPNLVNHSRPSNNPDKSAPVEGINIAITTGKYRSLVDA